MPTNQPSTLAKAHPDHPTLSELVSDRPDPAVATPLGHDIASPQHTTTPTSMSDADSSPTSPEAPRRLGGFSEGPNARSKSVTVASGEDTFGALNCHPAPGSAAISDSNLPSDSFRVGVSEDRNRRCRRTMEDAHSFVYDFAGVKGQGYFAVFDGHAGKHAAEWCGQNFHEYLLDGLLAEPDTPIPDLMNKTFHLVDKRLSHLAHAGGTSSGCTAVTAFLRVEEIDDNGNSRKGFTNPGLQARGLLEGKGEDELESQTSLQPSSRRSSMGGGTGGQMGGASTPGANGRTGSLARRLSSKKIRDFVKGLTGGVEKNFDEVITEDEGVINAADGTRVEAIEPKSEKGVRRVLYTANVGDARAVLCRGGKAVRLTYDHKGSDAQEAKRITDAGGFVMNNRVNGVLAVTRSLGDASMKEFVVGAPYTTETTLDEQDEFLIVACDGLWDVCSDQEAVEIVQLVTDPQEASKRLLDHAMSNFSTDNLSVMVVRFNH
ncbi:protein phosphatase [Cryptococcus neoformans C23]|uniref:Protein phosphatase n=1 Tax=Cryptococcus neoformans (strain H99 / ATCC 208821 / CBS 10515 / FGSC 9487) TaxID=235443 RepID=J9VGY4_CRYN9|nr:protein phosphatase [Cryptococcus neoformans var. grubii H99]AUB22081.1 protein phosphatase [Cryptococcus neoformans var. grubii]OWZ48086.1 protein phosphatase [Cryptococcus neoformans var. grubii C23]OWZ57059.1 protein phosphatase [Cryptococcus neoformans var. grubii AD1-83a]OXG40782.1 protein phosphatase [Cryptococcus neoformans var. grubii Bt15]OXG45446.1 protein phosphatase [Cryptococcus neoformans var. grubii Bt120]OXG54113.1 protein phosphatase [Cryptococcus neoformans var. grubii Th|eukprot:XP_012046759.1 protein phosphatase [Cryptococcus neoformans var. grubii H99]